jgi:hypothetical protein
MTFEEAASTIKAQLELCPCHKDGKRIVKDELKCEVLALMTRYKPTSEAAAKAFGLATSTIWKWRKDHAVRPNAFKRVVVEPAPKQSCELRSFYLKAKPGVEVHGLSLEDLVVVLREVAR